MGTLLPISFLVRSRNGRIIRMLEKQFRKYRKMMPQPPKKKATYAPHYYRSFQCVADKCRHSCCIDWEICIDEATYEKYKQLGSICGTVQESEDGPCFALREDGRCPHLNECGLCEIILTHGEDYLSEICRNHPRFYNRIGGARLEVGLGIVCEEACRLILETEEPFSLSEIEELEESCEADEDNRFDILPERERIIAVIEGPGHFQEKVAALRRSFEIPALHTVAEWSDRFLSLEILDPAWKKALRSLKRAQASERDTEAYEKYYARLLIYFVYRHVSTAADEEDLRARLGFALLSVDMIKALFEVNGAKALADLIDWARRYSAEIEYSEDNTEELIFAFESAIL